MPNPSKPLSPKIAELLEELRAWCDAPEGKGRRSEVARAVGVTRYAVTHWLGGRAKPAGEQVLKIQEFLRKQKRAKKG